MSRRAFRRNTSAVPLDYFLADGQANARSLILAASAVKSLERGKNPVEVLLFKADTVVFNVNLKSFIVCCGAEQINDRPPPLLVKLESTANQILE